MKKTLLLLFIIAVSVGGYYFLNKKNVSIGEIVSQISGKKDKWETYKGGSTMGLAVASTSTNGGAGFSNQSVSNVGLAGAGGGVTKSYKTKNISSPNIAFKVGADQDINLFRENIKNGHIPNPDVITYNGVFGDYHFNLPEGKCKTIFCPLLDISTGNNLDESSNYYIQFGLGSNIKEKDFKRQKTNFVFVIDVSGSMGGNADSYYYKNNDIIKNNKNKCGKDLYFVPGNKCIKKDEADNYKKIVKDYSGKTKIEVVKKVLKQFVDKLNNDDRLSVILFDNNGHIAHPLLKVKIINKEKLKKHIDELQPMGGTNMEAGLKKVEEVFKDKLENDYQNRVIFLTDAMPNIDASDPASLAHYVENFTKKKIYFTFIGIGIDFQQQFIQKLAKYPGTNYFFLANGYDAYRRLIDEFDYNFFPMLTNISVKVDDKSNIDKIYGLDTTNLKEDELMHINTLFPTPPTADGYRGSIILLKLKNKPIKDMKFAVSYTKLSDNTTEKVENTISVDNISNSSDIKKGVILVNYVDGLKKAIEEKDNSITNKLENYLKNNKLSFKGSDKSILEKEIETTKKLGTLLENNVEVGKDYWQEK